MATVSTSEKIGAGVTAAVIGIVGFVVGANVASTTTTKTVTQAVVSVETPTAPVRPTYRDVSLKVIAGNTAPLQWFRGRVSTQVTRDAMEETLASLALPEAYRYIRTISGCEGSVSSIVSNVNSVAAKLGPIYEFNSIAGNGSWTIPVNGRHYTFEKSALVNVQSCSVGSSRAAACAASPLMTGNLADLLDIRIENGKCVKGATDFAIIPPVEPYSTARAAAGSLIAKSALKFVPLTADQIALLTATHAAHVAVSDYRCGVGPVPTQNVQVAHEALEATATSETMHHFLRMKDFSGFADNGSEDGKASGWSPAEICKIARGQDAAHFRWMNAVIKGDWLSAREADNDHELFHQMMNAKGDKFLYVFSPFVVHPADKPCLPGTGLPTSSRLDCPKLTQAEVMAGL